MLLYVINVDSCIHVENYQIFLYEPVAKKQLDIFSSSWEVSSLTAAFGQAAEYMNRRGFENRDYQVLVCVRRKESERWKETTLYAKAMVAQALEDSGAVSVITGAFTRKVQVLFQVEQPYYGTVPRTSMWEEELSGLNCLMDILDMNAPKQKDAYRHENRTDNTDKSELIRAWDSALYEALEGERRMDAVTVRLKERLYQAAEEERLLQKEEFAVIDDEILEFTAEEAEEEASQDLCEYISHRIRSLLDGSGLNQAVEVIYWPVPMESSKAARISMFSLVDLIRTGEEVTEERVRECMTENHPDYEKNLLWRYRKALWGYRQQLCEKREQLFLEMNEKEEEETKAPILAISLPEISRVLLDKAELAKQQLINCAVSLQKSKRDEVKERIEDISQSLTEAFDGMERELSAYKNEVKACVYRELSDSTYLHQEKIQKLSEQRILQSADGRDETAAKAQIEQWKQDTSFLTACTQLTGFIPSFAYMLGTMAVASLPYFLYQGKVWTKKESLISSLCIWGSLLVFMAGKQLFMNRYFVKQISQSYAALEKKLDEILDEYIKRAERFQDEMREWLEVKTASQRKQLAIEKMEKEAKYSAGRAWHLAKMQKILDSLDTFGPMEQGFAQTQLHPEMTKRILQPMDYFQNEYGNEVYWPVIEKRERKEETDE